MQKEPKPTVYQLGGLAIVDLTGEPFDPQEFIDALLGADYSRLPRLSRDNREGNRD